MSDVPLDEFTQNPFLTSKHVSEDLLPIIAKLDLFDPNFNETSAAWQRFMLFVEMEQPLAAHILQSCRVSKHELRQLASKKEKWTIFLQEVFPFLVRFPAESRRCNPRIFSRTRLMAVIQLIGVLCQIPNFRLKGNISTEGMQLRVLMVPVREFDNLFEVRYLRHLGVEVLTQIVDLNAPALSVEENQQREDFARAWRLRDLPLLLELIQLYVK